MKKPTLVTKVADYLDHHLFFALLIAVAGVLPISSAVIMIYLANN